jgi:hypothetical protein
MGASFCALLPVRKSWICSGLHRLAGPGEEPQLQRIYQQHQFQGQEPLPVHTIQYKLFGINPWAWHLLFITLHTINACLLFSLVRGLLKDAGVAKADAIAAAGVLLYCVSPYISEVIVWEPSFHFLQGLLLILLVLKAVQRYLNTGAAKYAWAACFIYLLSTFTLEVFYVTPWLVLAMGLFYQYNDTTKKVLGGVAKLFFAPMLLLFVIRLLAYRLCYGDWVSRIGSGTVGMVNLHSFGKPAKYLFHLLFVGRFWSEDLRHTVYGACDSVAGICLFYGIALLVIVVIGRRFAKMNGIGKVASLLFVWMCMVLLVLVPLWFQSDMLVWYDRYTYFTGAFFYMLVAVAAGFISVAYMRYGVLGLFAVVNLRFAIQVSRYWGKSYKVVNSLLHTIPDDRSKTMLLLNLPQNMHGVAMIGAEKNSEFKLMHDELVPGKPLTNTVYDVLAYNMLTPTDGVNVTVINDSLIKVELNQWGTWWWYETKGGHSYWTGDYKIEHMDVGRWYELTLRKPADQYLLLYSVGGVWKTVDIAKKGVKQE